MNEYALLVSNVFRETRFYTEQPKNIPHKKMVWLPVVRQVGNTAFSSAVNNTWVIQTQTPAAVKPQVVSARQARLALLNNNLLDDVELIVSLQNKSIQIAWEYATEIYRTDELITTLAKELKLSNSDVDRLFLEASLL